MVEPDVGGQVARPETRPGDGSDRHLAVLIPSMDGGGAERVVANLLRGFVHRGCRVDLLLVNARGPLLDEVPPDVRMVPLAGGRIIATLPSLIAYLRRERPGALLSHLDTTNLVALWARRAAGVDTRVVVTTHVALGRHSRSVAVRGRLVGRLVNRFYCWADGVVGVSEGVTAELAQRIPPDATNLRTIYNPVVSDELLERAWTPHGNAAEGPLPGIPAEARVILSAGRLTPQKNQALLIDAFADVATRIPDLLLVILGEGPERDRLHTRAKARELAGRVLLPGFVLDPAPYFRRASVFALSSDWEGLPTVLIEALAFGCQIVSTRCPFGPAEILEDGMYGRLVPTGDRVALGGAILDALREPLPRALLRRRALDFNADRCVSGYLDVLFPGHRGDRSSTGEG